MDAISARSEPRRITALARITDYTPDATGRILSYKADVQEPGGITEHTLLATGPQRNKGTLVTVYRYGSDAIGGWQLAESVSDIGTQIPATVGGLPSVEPTLITGLGFHLPKGDGCIIVGGQLVRDPNPRVTGTRVRICANGIKGLTDAGNGDRMAFMLATEDHTTFENDQPVSIGAGDAQLGYRDTGHLYVDSAGGSFAWRVGTQTLWQSQMVGDLPYTQMAGLLRLSDTYVGEGIEMGKDHRDAYIIQLLNKYGIPLILMRAGFDDDPNRAYMRIGPPPPHPNIEISSYPDGTPYIIMDGAALRPSSVTYTSLNILQISDISGNMGVLQAGRAEFLQPGTSFVHWLDFGDATGIVAGYDDQTQTGRILGLDGGVIQTEMDGTGRLLWGAGNGWADADGIGLEIGSNSVNGLTWYDSGNDFLRVFSDNNTDYTNTNALKILGLDTDDVSLNILSGSGNATPAEYILLGQDGAPATVHGLLLAAPSYGGFWIINADGGASPEYLSFGISTAGTIAEQIKIVATTGNLLLGTGWETVPGATTRAIIQTSVQTDTILRLEQGNAAHTGAYLIAGDTNGTRFTLNGDGTFTSKILSALTNTHAVHTWGHNTSGTAAASFALRHLYQLESSTTADQDAAAFDVLWTTATHASRTAYIRWLLVNNAGALAEYMRLAPSLLTVTPESMFRNHLTLDDDSGASPELKWVAEDGSTVRAWKENGGDFKFASNAGGIDFSGINGSFAIGSKNFSMGRDLTLAGGHDLHIYFDATSGADGTITMGSGGLDIQTSGGDLSLRPNGNVTIGGSPPSTGKLRVDGIIRTNNSIIANGNSFIGDDANANTTLGLTINQGAADDEILAFKSSDVAHGVTSITETDTYGALQKAVADEGGLAVWGYTETKVGLDLIGVATTFDSSASTSALGAITVRARKKSGTSYGALGSNEFAFAVRNSTSTKFLVDAEGDIHYDGSAAAYDAYDDVQLVRALDHAIAPANIVRNQFDAWLKYNRADVVAAGILSDGGFVNLTQLTRLHSGAIWQMHTQMMELRQEIAALRERLN